MMTNEQIKAEIVTFAEKLAADARSDESDAWTLIRRAQAVLALLEDELPQTAEAREEAA